MKRKTKALLISSVLLLSTVLMSACNSNSMRTPDKLVEKPINNEAHLDIYNALRKLTPLDSNFILPLNGIEVGKINIVRFGKEREVVAFKRMQNESQSTSIINVYIFKLKDDNELASDSERVISVPGETLKYANFIDFDNNGSKDLVMQITNKGTEDIYIYSYRNGNLTKKAGYVSKNASIRLNYYDYEGNGRKECLALMSNVSKDKVEVNRMIYRNGKIEFEYDTSIKGISSIERMYLTNGKVYKDIRGTILTYPVGGGEFRSQLLTMKNGKFVTNFSDNDSKLKNEYLLKPYDIEDDGILEFPKLENSYINTSPKRANFISWYRWNGKRDTYNNLKISEQVFYSYDYNFKLTIPRSLYGRTYVRETREKDVITYTFYEKTDDDEKQLKLFDICVHRKTEDYDAKSNTQMDKSLIMSTDSNLYYFRAYKDNNNRFTYSDAKKAFRLLNK